MDLQLEHGIALGIAVGIAYATCYVLAWEFIKRNVRAMFRGYLDRLLMVVIFVPTLNAYEALTSVDEALGSEAGRRGFFAAAFVVAIAGIILGSRLLRRLAK